MKFLSAVLLACSLSASFAVHAETASSNNADVQQTAQATTHRAADDQASQRPGTKSARDADTCVGPVSYCNIFFGS
jgi:hypothetical protein